LSCTTYVLLDRSSSLLGPNRVLLTAANLQGHEHAREQPRLLGTTENELGLRKWLEDQGHTLVTTSDKDSENSTFDKELVDAEVIITTP